MDSTSSSPSLAVSRDFAWAKVRAEPHLLFVGFWGGDPLPFHAFFPFLGPTASCHSRIHFGPFGLDSARSRPRLVEEPPKHDPTVQASPKSPYWAPFWVKNLSGTSSRQAC